MKGKKFLPVLVLVLLVALGALGVAYAQWDDNLILNGSVETGYMDPDWVITSVDDNEEAGSDYADCDAAVDDDVNATITITNAYPDYVCTVDGAIKNNGTVPMKFVHQADTWTATWAALVINDEISVGDTWTVGASKNTQLVITILDGAPQGASATGAYTMDFESVTP